jgi:small subunit ribosomal protein S8
MMTDPIADMLTRIRNGNRVEKPAVDMPASKQKVNIARVLKDEGFILDYQVGQEATDADTGMPVFKEVQDLNLPRIVLRVWLKYGPEGERVIRHIQRGSKPGGRHYVRAALVRPVLDGLGISIISTSKGMMSDRQARAQRLGGELIARIW